MKKKGINIRLLFILVVLVGEAAIIGGGALILGILDHFFDFLHYVPLVVWMLLFGVVLGIFIAAVVYGLFCGPIIRISQAMKKVAEGDFDIRLETDSSIREVQDIHYSFNLMTKELGATEILQTDFVSNVSHEFKTPINAIEGYAMLLQEHSDVSPDHKEYTERILYNTRRLSDLVGNILLLSRVENQNIQTREEHYRLDEQIRQVIVMLENKWTEKEMDLDVDLDEISYCGDEGLLFHVWNNLMENAIKFGPQGGMIRMKLFQKEEQIIYEIEDNGPGISKHAQKHIFDKFFQDDTSHKAAGNGLGLSLVKKILDLSKGEISVENIVSGGCRFTVVLPHKE